MERYLEQVKLTQNRKQLEFLTRPGNVQLLNFRYHGDEWSFHPCLFFDQNFEDTVGRVVQIKSEKFYKSNGALEPRDGSIQLLEKYVDVEWDKAFRTLSCKGYNYTIDKDKKLMFYLCYDNNSNPDDRFPFDLKFV